MAATKNVLEYWEIQDTLKITDALVIEDLVLESIYSRLIDATIDERNKCLHISKTVGRDVPPEKVDELVAELEDWVK